MSLKLSDLLGVGVAPKVVKINGLDVQIRMLTAAETLAIARLAPEPALRLAPGARVTPEVEATIAPLRVEREATLKCLEAAAAIGYVTAGGHAWDLKHPSEAWAKEAKAELLGALSQEQVMELWGESKRLGMTSLMETARGNSSSPATGSGAPPA